MILLSDQFAEIRWRTLEGNPPGAFDLPSGLWSPDEVTEYFNERQNRFNRDTKLILAHVPIPFAANQPSAPAPDDWIATQNASWITRLPAGGPIPNFSTTVNPGDRYTAERATSPTDNLTTRPIIVDDTSGGPLTLELFPVPTEAGLLDVLYACVLSHLSQTVTSTFDLPDDFVPFVTYGVLADMLAKDGRGQDLARAAYCEDRYRSGVLVAAIMLEGYIPDLTTRVSSPTGRVTRG